MSKLAISSAFRVFLVLCELCVIFSLESVRLNLVKSVGPQLGLWSKLLRVSSFYMHHPGPSVSLSLPHLVKPYYYYYHYYTCGMCMYVGMYECVCVCVDGYS